MRLHTAALLTGLAPMLFAGHPAFADQANNSIRFAYDQAPESIDPYFNNVRIGVIIGQHVWDTLVYRDPSSNEYKGLLAESWERIDDRTLEFKLRQGVTFHNGEAFNADDVVYTLNFVADPENGVTTQQNVAWIDRAEKVDDYTVRVISKEVFPAAIEYLSGPLAIHPNEYYEEVGPEGMDRNPVGTGPFKVVSNEPGKAIVLEKNEAYFEGSPKEQGPIETVDIRIIPDRQTQVAEMLSQGMDFVMHVPKDQAEQMEQVPFLQVVSGETMRIVFMQMNTLENSPAPALKDERVRKAIMHAIDRETIASEIVGAGARVLDVICFPSQTGCDASAAPTYDYDPEKSRALLAEAGYGDGLALDIVAYRERNQTEAIIGYLKAVGIDARLNFLQYAAMREQIRAGEAELTHQTWGSFSVNDVSASTPVYFKFEADDITRNPEVRDLLQKGDTTIEPEARNAAYRDALALIAEHVYGVPLWSLPVYYVATSDLDFTAYPDEMPRFWEMDWKD
ncbi:ABC transporter substrate-binding protein [Fulvimarina endophytica]|uniref:ABC transporter substrate-binding protein n=1 Tax=Fulvimarina endophytica TaxID=2293836 RepID=A0A371WYH5_9HYPH|nr:ABC transporter substrate-binding protein [Fulvimarina endophytica]RFC62040.1 ABC transporter substrate-binding protein [Fulvimarina endophytica]